MPTQLQIRRGSTSDHTSFTGAAGELTVNTTKDTVRVHDGSTAGGFELARADGSNLNAITNDITVNGTVNAQIADISTKVIVNGATPRLELFESDVTDQNTRIRVTSGNLQIQSTDDAGTTTQTRVAIDNSDGEFALYNAAGASKKLVWDATNLRLGINNTTPTEALDVTGNIRFGETSPAHIYTNVNELRLGVDNNNDNATSDITFYADGSEKVRMDKDGHLIVPNGVTLGVAVDAYAASNTLDDYEEGTWTPVIADASSGGNTGTAATAVGSYTKVGRQVTVNVRIDDLDTTGMTGANNLYIRGLPFTAGSGTTGQSQGTARLDRFDLAVDCCGVVVSTTSATTTLTLRQTIDNAADVQVKVQDVTSGSADVFATITYFAS